MSRDLSTRYRADAAFSQARRRAFFQRILGFITGNRPGGLLSLEEVRDKLKIRGQHYAGIQTIDIDRIVGSGSRYNEFNRAFLPTQEHVRERWTRVYEAAHGAGGFPPIDVYQIGDVFFVRDGHHRVSVLRELDAPTVEATVTVLDTPVPLSSSVAEEDLDLKAEYAEFLQATKLDSERNEQRIEFTVPGQYRRLYEHIAVHRHFLGLEQQHEIPWGEAVVRWYDEVYMPLVEVIREEGVLEQFPGRKEADLYLWIIEHQHYLSERYGQDVPLDRAAADFSAEFSRGQGKKQLEAGAVKGDASRGRSRKKHPLVAVFGSGRPPADHPVLGQAERLGQLLAEAGYAVMSGGYGGTMEAVSRGARQAGSSRSRVVGVTMDLFTPPLQPNAWLTEEKRVPDFLPRLKHLTSADAFVVLQGGIGTLTEAALVWSFLQTGQIPSRPFIFAGEAWRRLFDALRAETFMTDRDYALATVVQDVDQVLDVLGGAFSPSP